MPDLNDAQFAMLQHDTLLLDPWSLTVALPLADRGWIEILPSLEPDSVTEALVTDLGRAACERRRAATTTP